MSYKKTPNPVNTRTNPIIKPQFSRSDTVKAELIRKIVPPTSKITEIANMNT